MGWDTTSGDLQKIQSLGGLVGDLSSARAVSGFRLRERFPGRPLAFSSPFNPTGGGSISSPLAGGLVGPQYQAAPMSFFLSPTGGGLMGLVGYLPQLTGEDGLVVDDDVIHGYESGGGIDITDNVISTLFGLHGVLDVRWMRFDAYTAQPGEAFRWDYDMVEVDPEDGTDVASGLEVTVRNVLEDGNDATHVWPGQLVANFSPGFEVGPVGWDEDGNRVESFVLAYEIATDVWVIAEENPLHGVCQATDAVIDEGTY